MSTVKAGDDEDVFFGTVGDSKSASSKPWVATVSVNSFPIELLIDTGVEVTVLSEETWMHIGKPTLSPPGHTLKGPSTHKLSTPGKFTAELSLHDRSATAEMYVVCGLHQPLLGRPAIEKLHLVSRIASVGNSELIPAEQFPKQFKGLGKLEGCYQIQFQVDA